MKRSEALFTTKFLKWARGNISDPSVFEIKSTRGKTGFPISELKEHQRNALLAAKHGAFTHKIRDTGYINPFDAVLFTRMQAYVVIEYVGFFVVIDIDDIPSSGSLNELKAKEKAAHVVRL